MRSAESDRTSSCLFADRVSSLSISAFHDICPSEIRYKQTVLSTFLVEDRRTGHLQVVALGVGTKTVPSAVLQADPSSAEERICDHHAGDRLVNNICTNSLTLLPIRGSSS